MQDFSHQQYQSFSNTQNLQKISRQFDLAAHVREKKPTISPYENLEPFFTPCWHVQIGSFNQIPRCISAMRCKESVQDRVNTLEQLGSDLSGLPFPTFVFIQVLPFYLERETHLEHPLRNFKRKIYTLYIDHGDFSSQFSMEHFCQSNGCSFQVPAALESFEMLIDLQYQWKGLRLRSSEAAVVLPKLIQMTLQLDNSYSILSPNSTQFCLPFTIFATIFPKKIGRGKQKFWSSFASSIHVKTRQPI